MDGWPVDSPRRFGMHVDQMRIGLEVCAAGRLLGVFPDPVARSFREGVLHRLPIEVVPPTRMFAAHRPSLGLDSRAQHVLEAVRARV